MTNQLNLGRAYSLASSNYSYIDCVKCQISSHLIRGGAGGGGGVGGNCFAFIVNSYSERT